MKIVRRNVYMKTYKTKFLCISCKFNIFHASFVVFCTFVVFHLYFAYFFYIEILYILSFIREDLSAIFSLCFL